METGKQQTCTLGWAAQLCRGWLFQEKATRNVHGRSPNGTLQGVTSSLMPVSTTQVTLEQDTVQYITNESLTYSYSTRQFTFGEDPQKNEIDRTGMQKLERRNS